MKTLDHVIMPQLLMNFVEPKAGKRLHNFLNLWAVEDALVGVDLQFSLCYEIFPPDLEFKNEDEHSYYFQGLRNVLHGLPENTTVQILVQSRRGDGGFLEKYLQTLKSPSETASFIARQKAAYLSGQPVEKRRTFLFFTTWPSEMDLAKVNVGGFKFSGSNMKDVTRDMHESRLGKIKFHGKELAVQLMTLGIGVRPLEGENLLSFLHEHLNPSRNAFLPPRPYNPQTTLRSQIALNAGEHEFTYFHLDGYYHRAVNLAIRPETVEFRMGLNFLRRLKADFDFCVTVHSVNQDTAAKKLQREATVSRIVAGTRVFLNYQEAHAKADAAESLLADAKDSFQKIFHTSFAVVLRNPDLAQLTTDTNAAVQAFRQVGEAEGLIDDMNHLPVFLASLPGHSHLNIRRHPMLTDAVTQILPLSAPWLGSAEPKIVFQTDDRQLLPYNLFDSTLDAKHFLILGSSGSGKSFTTNTLLSNFYVEDEKNHVVIVDDGGSYRKLCNLFHGQYLAPDLSNPEEYAFNPFPLKSVAVKNDEKDFFEVDVETLTYLTALVQKMLRVKEFSGQEKMILQKAVTETYRHCTGEAPLLEDLERQLLNFDGDEEDKKAARSFAKNLKLWTSGSYGKMLNRPTTLNVRARLVVFDLQKLGDEQADLKSIIVFIIKNVIYSKLADKSLRKMIVIDEAWKFLNDPAGVVLIKDLYKTARKFNAAIGTISQSAVDMVSCLAKEAIIENSYVKYVLRLGGGFDLLPEFKLTEEDIARIKGLTSEKGVYSDVFVRFDKHRRVIRIKPSPTDYWVCTTDPDDEAVENKVRRDNPEFDEVRVLQELSKLRS